MVVKESPSAQAVVINAGIANACTGVQGMACCEATARKSRSFAETSKRSYPGGVHGVIGMQLPIDRLEKAWKPWFPIWQALLVTDTAQLKR